MAELKEKIAYIQGLADGLNLDDKSAEGKILRHILEVLEDMADIVEDIDLGQAELEDYVEAIDEDLAELEKDFLEREVECSCDHDHYSDEDLDDLDDLDDVDVEEIDDDEVEVECPHCGEVAYVEEEDLADEELEILCPNCGKVLFESTESDDDDEL
ncbi:CD1247 N-terminal domain-containing protein [Anaerobranca gottschalkii]|uniref:TFIIB-type domain-containing protein n=1 Tax=Anaerobranca gottschalkii DSM 13577 TaxID=1120990 RepID=A0A1H9Y2K4_9FIRM|nr:CD1247 N-terminal domain-containing protein [Anaerobranca gottschalkii]SES63007.1 hypothetical protein SAMN03080614_1001107 [Anaerobranca gottschalkii DSM 13577]